MVQQHHLAEEGLWSSVPKRKNYNFAVRKRSENTKNLVSITEGTPKTRRRREKMCIFGQNLGNFLKISLLRTSHTPGVSADP